MKTRTQPAAPAAPESGPRFNSLDPIAGLGTCANDVRFLAQQTLAALGVNPNADNGRPSASTIMQHAIERELFALDLVIDAQRDDHSPAAFALIGVRERLSLIIEYASVLADIREADPREGPVTR
jgi:hypothetical protein